MNANAKTPLQRALAMLLSVAMLFSVLVMPIGATELENEDATETTAPVETGAPAETEAPAKTEEPAATELPSDLGLAVGEDISGVSGAFADLLLAADERVSAIIAAIDALPSVETVDATLRSLRPADVNDTAAVNAHLAQLTEYKKQVQAAEVLYYYGVYTDGSSSGNGYNANDVSNGTDTESLTTDAQRAQVTNFSKLEALKARLAEEVLPKAGDITTATVAESNIDFNLYNYSREINRVLNGNGEYTWRKNSAYFKFQNANYAGYDPTDTTASGFADKFYSYNLWNGYPIMNVDYITANGGKATEWSKEDRSFAYLFGGEDYEENAVAGSVTKYEDIINLPVTYDPATGYYSYSSQRNATDCSITENKV